jgi:predicted KAP-like P-loop ATPase
MWNDKETDVDLLGHDKIAQTVVEIIRDNNLRPLTIGIYGDWGVGKSSILSLLQTKLKAEKATKLSYTHCILFNGWLFQGYEDTKTALMEIVVSELAALQPTNKKIQKLTKSLLRRVNWLKVAKFSAGVLLTGVTGLPVAGIAGEVISQAKMLAEKDDVDLFAKKGQEEETVTSQIHAFRKEFKELISTSKAEHVIVLVDDLDRCLPKAVIEILEAIRLFLFVEGTTFVISADEKMIEYAVKEHFPNLPSSYAEYTKNYLEKLIQIPLRIPTLNRLQTGNYIKLLMLQNHLKNDFDQLKAVYEAYNKKKRRPYDPIDLSYQIITEAIGSANTELQETLLVAGQLTPTLSVGLKGNPRNIKRFLNTLFLRMRIAKIYELDDIVQLKVLAKLMLLERFQTEIFDRVVEEVTTDQEGKSKTIREVETPSVDASETNRRESGDDLLKKQLFKEWSQIEPPLGETNLRPYIYISKEKAIGFDSDGLLPEHLIAILEQLKSNTSMALNQAEKDLAQIPLKERTLLFEKLEAESRSINDLKNIPACVQGLLRIIIVEVSLEERFVGLMEAYPATSLGPWAISELTGLKSPVAIDQFKRLLQKWQQSDNKILKSLAQQTLINLTK